MTFHSILAALAVATSLAMPAIGHAQTTRIVVQTGDLDLSGRAGRDVLHRRLLQAARDACGNPASYGEAGYQADQACLDGARRSALAIGDRMIAARTPAYRLADASR